MIVQDAEQDLGICVPLFTGGAKPPNGFRVILMHA